MEKPRRRYKLTLDLEFDTSDDFNTAWHSIEFDLHLKQKNNRLGDVNIASGGVTAGWNLTVNEDASMNTEKYHCQINEYLKAAKG